MRISDSMRYKLFQMNVSKVGKQLDDIETRISTQKNINTPSDDPIRYSTNIQYNAELSLGSQYNSNLQCLSTMTSMYDVSFGAISSQLDNLMQLANNFDTLDQDLKVSAMQQIEGMIEQFATIGNTKLGNSYIFGGQQADVPPFQLNNDYSVTYTVGQYGEDATKIYVDKGQTSKCGISGREAFYSTSKIAFGSVSNTYTGDVYSNTESFAYVIDGSNNQIVLNGGATVVPPLASGVYNGAGLAKEIQDQIGPDYSVAFESSTRKFVITNNTGADVTFNWLGSNAANTLGFDAIDSVIASGQTEKSDVDTGKKTFLVEINTGGATTGATRATYNVSVDGGMTWINGLTVNTGGADTTAGDITITDGTNDIFYLNGSTVVDLTGGTYTGAALAAEIQIQLGAGYSVSYNAETRKFGITNNTGSVVTLNWSNVAATAAGILGFDTVDSVVSNGANDVSDYDAGMFIDGAGVANTTNNRMKLAFSTNPTDALIAGETFQVKDLSIFELLKNFRDAFESDNSTWVSQNIKYIDTAESLTTKNNAIIAFQGTLATTLTENNKTKEGKIQNLQADLVNADMSELATEFNTLLNTYQALLSTLARMQSVSILNYLK
jgi:flagellin-like hook-associated protein FlgL